MAVKDYAVVLGTGTMGRGIAMELIKQDIPVVIWGRRNVADIRRMLAADVCRQMQKSGGGLLNPNDILSRIKVTNDLECVKGAYIVIESIVENIDEKLKLFESINAYVMGSEIIATNTSSLSINDMNDVVKQKELFAGLHFFNPVSRMALVEIIRGKYTSIEVIEELKRFVFRIKKEYVVVNDSPGFIVNRILLLGINTALQLLQQGISTKEEIDKAMKLGANHPIGPIMLCDLIGLDVVYEALNNMYQQLKDDTYKPAAILEEYINSGHLGRKSGKGFYEYK
jgi:3-hydroxybutyryl-CoA dehydrogenase